MSDINLLRDFNDKLSKLSKLIKSWDLIQSTSKREFDLLAEKILNNLYEGQTELKIKRIIESELLVTYGLYKTEFDSEKLIVDIMNLWHE